MFDLEYMSMPVSKMEITSHMMRCLFRRFLVIGFLVVWPAIDSKKGQFPER